MAVGGDRAHARQHFVAGLERFQPAGRGIRRHGITRHLEEGLHVLRLGCRDDFAQPEVCLRRGHVDLRVGVRRLALRRQQPAGVIGMQVGQQHHVDLLGLIARRAHIAQQATHGRAEAGAGAGVDQDPLAAGIDQIAVHRRLHARRGRHEHPREQALDRLRAQAQQRLRGQVDIAVIQRGHDIVTQRHAVVARHLRTLLRGGRRRRRGLCLDCTGGSQQGSRQGSGACRPGGHGKRGEQSHGLGSSGDAPHACRSGGSPDHATHRAHALTPFATGVLLRERSQATLPPEPHQQPVRLMDSHRPSDEKRGDREKAWWARWVSNPRPNDYESSALTLSYRPCGSGSQNGRRQKRDPAG